MNRSDITRVVQRRERRDESRRGTHECARYVFSRSSGRSIALYLSFILFALGLPVVAATVQGTVRDPSGALVAGAVVTISSAASSETRTTKTDARGHFSVDDLVAGEYQIAVQQPGFENAERAVTIGKEPKVDIDIQLKIQAQETVVEVSGKRSSLANSDLNYRALRDAGITEVIRVENVTLKRDAGELRLRSGLVGFLPPILGHVAIAVFAGQASFHLEPAFSLEANYLQMLTDNKTVDEEFDSAVLCFTDATYQELKREGSAAQSTNGLTDALRDFHHRMRHRNETPRSMLEAMLTYDEIPNVEAELLAQLYNAKSAPSFSAYIHGRRYHDLRFLIDPRGAMRHLPSPEEVGLIHLDPLGTHEGIFYLTHLKSEWQNSTASSNEDKRIVGLKHYRIETAISKSGRLTAAADVTFEALRDGDRVIDFGLLPTLRVTRVAASDGKEIGFIQEDRKEDGSFYALLPQPMVKGQTYTLHVEYEGNKVIENAGNGSFSVGARTSWYPSLNTFNDRATFDLTFRVPKQYTVVGVGKLVKQWREDNFSGSQWVSDVPLAVAGFNYGDFKKKQREDSETKYSFEAYATSEVPDYLRGHGFGNMSPSAMSESAMVDALNSIRVFEHFFGPLPYGRIALTQQPEFSFGQSWPTLVYLPVSAFLDSTQRWALLGGNAFRFGDFIQEVTPHEVSHQWWGHMVGWATYHDQWLSEGFADFSAGLFLQSTEKKPDKFNEFWERGRKAITEKNQFGNSANDAGPLWMGLRLNTFKTGRAYQKLVYPKGGYILHMIRQMMWDPKTQDRDFIDLMHDYVKSNEQKNASTEDFRTAVNRHMKKDMDLAGNGKFDWFFRQWVYGTEIPRYRLEYSLTPGDGGKVLLTGKVTQSDVSATFRMPVPVYIEFDEGIVRLGSVVVQGNATAPEFKINLPRKPKRVLLNANHDVLNAENVVVGR
jgi:hypothetical protein